MRNLLPGWVFLVVVVCAHGLFWAPASPHLIFALGTAPKFANSPAPAMLV